MQIASQTLTLVVPDPLVLTNPAVLPPATPGQFYSFQLTAAGGSGPRTWEVAGLPAGVVCHPVTGLISGIPTQSGSFALTVQCMS